MILDRAAREYYALEISTTPDVAAWEASFDDGTTWVPSTTVGTDGYYRWLVAGPDVAPGEGATVLAGECGPDRAGHRQPGDHPPPRPWHLPDLTPA